jgi:hypothetical protein
MVLNAFTACRTAPNRASQSPSPTRLSADWMGRLSTPGGHRRSDTAHGPNIMSHANGLAEAAHGLQVHALPGRAPGSRAQENRETAGIIKRRSCCPSTIAAGFLASVAL